MICAIKCIDCFQLLLFFSIPGKKNSIPYEPRDLSDSVWSISHDVIQLLMARSLCHSVWPPLFSLSLSFCMFPCLSPNTSSHANESYLSLQLQSTQCPPWPYRLSNLSWPEYQWQQSSNSLKLEVERCMNYINLKSGNVKYCASAIAKP